MSETEKTKNLDKFLLDDRYETEEMVGSGTTGIVYKGKDNHTDETVAIKILNHELSKHDKFVQQLKIEIDAILHLSNSNIVTVKGSGKSGDKCYIILEHIKCRSLTSLLKESPIIPLDKSIEILKQLSLALGYTGSNGIAHKALNTDNVLITDDNHVKISGFGINKALATAWLTMTGTSNANVEYMSPEQAEGEEADYKSDIYSLGIIAYQILTGDVPFKRDASSKSILSVAMKHINSPPPLLTEKNSEIPKWLEDVVLKCLEKKPSDRFQTGNEIYDCLNEEKSPYGGGSSSSGRISIVLPTPKEDVVAKPKQEDNNYKAPTWNESSSEKNGNQPKENESDLYDEPNETNPSNKFLPPQIKQVTVNSRDVKNKSTVVTKPPPPPTGPLPIAQLDLPTNQEPSIIKVDEMKQRIMLTQMLIGVGFIIIILLVVLILKK